MPQSASRISESALREFVGGQLVIERQGKELLCGEIAEVWITDGFLHVRFARLAHAARFSHHGMPEHWEWFEPIPPGRETESWKADGFLSARHEGSKVCMRSLCEMQILVFHDPRWPYLKEKHFRQKEAAGASKVA